MRLQKYMRGGLDVSEAEVDSLWTPYADAQRALDAEREKAKQLGRTLADVYQQRDGLQAQLRQVEGRQEGKDYAWNEAAMRAACAAHRACCGIEADNSQGKIHGCCVVCGVPWPCETAQFFLFKADARAAQMEEGE